MCCEHTYNTIQYIENLNSAAIQKCPGALVTLEIYIKPNKIIVLNAQPIATPLTSTQHAPVDRITLYPNSRQMASALAHYSKWAELPLLVLLMLFGSSANPSELNTLLYNSIQRHTH